MIAKKKRQHRTNSREFARLLKRWWAKKCVQQSALYNEVIFDETPIDKRSIHLLLFGIVYSL